MRTTMRTSITDGEINIGLCTEQAAADWLPAWLQLGGCTGPAQLYLHFPLQTAQISILQSYLQLIYNQLYMTTSSEILI